LTSSAPCAACGGTGRAGAGGGGAACAPDRGPGPAGPAAARVTVDVERDGSGRAVCVTRRAFDEKDRLIWQSVEYLPDDPGGGGGGGEAGEAVPGALVREIHYSYYGL
jgi:hypothetical protein